MEAMTQEFMLHRRPHAEIWSAREGSDDDTSKVHLSNKPLTDPKQCQQRTRDPPQKPKFWWISTNHGPSQIPQNWETNHNHLQSSNSTKPHVHLVHIRNIRCCFSNKRLTASNTSGDQNKNKTWTKHRCSSLDPITHPIRNRRLRQILTARILRRQKSRRRNGKP